MCLKPVICLSILFLLVANTVALGQAQGNVTYVSWHDPKENAFSLEVPQGWNIEGGLIRNFANPSTDVRPCVRATSPDGMIIATQWEVTTYNTTQPPSGLAYANWYIVTYPEAGTTDITITSMDEDNGSLTYTCYKNNELMNGVVVAKISPLGLGTWQLPGWQFVDLFSYLAPAAKENVAYSVCEHMRQTWQSNPQLSSSNSQNVQDADEQYNSKLDQRSIVILPKKQYPWNCGGTEIYSDKLEPPAGYSNCTRRFE